MFSERIKGVIDRVDRLRDQVDDHWQIPRDEAMVLAQLVRIGRCISICEIGTSYGFSTLHLAAAASGTAAASIRLTQTRRRSRPQARASRRLASQRSSPFMRADARTVLTGIKPQAPFDFVFIDATKAQSNEYLDAVWNKLAPGCVLVTDNTATHAEELAPFVARLRSLPEFTSCGVAVGNGFELTVRRP